jgi:D-alanyl-lipoteichoic acid acyltransferase DltB (MBOAT superfamily)
VTVPSIPFLLFAAVAALVFNLRAASGWWREAVLLTANIAFLASFSNDPVAFLPLAGFLALGFVAQSVTREGSAPRLFVALLIVTLAAFFWLKRYSFIPGATFLPFPYLLVGLSYVFFRVLHLIIDSHQGAIEGRISLLSYVNYTLNFTALTSGPIQRYQDYRQAEIQPSPLNLAIAGSAVERIIIGYFKVAIVSMLLSQAQHRAIDVLGSSAGGPERIWAGILIAAIYPVYLYFNFSGYVDVVIGVARFFRIELPENFDRPFTSENFIIFWSRWHMTLSGWLKTYVYNPLMMAGMARITAPELAPYIAVVAFFVTFFLVGVWHGQTSEFLFFGFLQGGGVAANKLYQVLMRERLGRKAWRALGEHNLYRASARGMTFTWFAFTLFWFWSNWAQIGGFATALGPVALILVWLAIFGAATLILASMEAARTAGLSLTWDNAPIVRSRYLRTAWDTALVVVTVTVIVLLDSPAPDIVYKTF